MDVERLRVLQVSVDLAYSNWSKDPTRLSYMKNLRNALEILQDETIDELLGYGWQVFDEQETAKDTTDEETSSCLCSSCVEAQQKKKVMSVEEMTFQMDHAIRVEILDDYDLVGKMLTWLCDRKDVNTFRGGSSGRGCFIGWFPAEHLEDLNRFFAENTDG